MNHYYVFAYSSRTETMQFYRLLSQNRIPCQIINTPRAITLGCGLSVRVAPQYYGSAASLFARSSNQSFLGAYDIIMENGVVKTRRVIS